VGWASPLSSITSLIAINQVTSLLGVLFGPLSDRLGYRKMMIAGMVTCWESGMLAAAFFPLYAVVLVALFHGSGLGKSIFDPAVQAWAGNRVPYRRRALVIGHVGDRLGRRAHWSAFRWWPSSWIRYGWRSPFLVMGALGCVGAVALFLIIPNDPVSQYPPNLPASEYLWVPIRG
jgi:MFS family permease